MLGKIEGKRRKGWQRIRWLDGITDSMDMNLSKLWEIVEDRGLVCSSPWGCKELEMRATEQEQQIYAFYNCAVFHYIKCDCETNLF